VHANGQHFRTIFTFGVKDVKAITQVLKKMLTRVEALGRGKTHVIGVKRVGDD
jgi:hypothetical protein